jgi:serine protease AprX
MVVVVTVPDDGVVRRREGAVAACAATIALTLGIATPASALGGLGGPALPIGPVVTSTVALLDPALEDALATAAADEVLEVAVVLPSIPSFTDLALLESTGAVVAGFDELRMAAAAGTPAEIEAIAALSLAESLWLDVALEETLDQSTELIQAAAAWAEPRPAGEPLGYTGRGVGVAVIDSGIDGLHPGVSYPDVTVQNVRPVGFKDVGTGTPVWEAAVEDVAVTDVTSGHGSHVAGIIAGRGTAAGQYRGVAPGAHLIGLGASDGLEMLTILQSYDWILAHAEEYGIRVINNSWAHAEPQVPYLDEHALDVASEAAVDAGLVVVFGAGNAGKGGDVFNNYARNDWVVSVGAVNKHGAPSSFSSRGNATHHATVVAPGEYIASVRATAGVISQANATPFDLTEPTAPRMVPVDQWPYYTVKTGTSMAAPHVSGVVALMLEANPDLTPAQVRQLLVGTATGVPGCAVEDCGAGMVNALAAVRAALGAAEAPPVAVVTAAPTSGSAPLEVTFDGAASYDPDGAVASYRWDWEGDGTVDAVTTSPGAVHTFDRGVHRARLTVVDDDGLASLPVSVEIRASDPPVASATVPRTGRGGEPLTFDASASTDPDGTIVSYEWNFGDGTAPVVTTAPTIARAYTVTRPTVFGWSVTVVDDAGGRDSVGGTVRITP